MDGVSGQEIMKRQINAEEGTQPSKKPNVDDGRVLYLKLLVPSCSAGSIIGKSGKNLAQIIEVSGAKIRFSNIYDCYPGTSDRFCLISGNLLEIKSALKIVLNKITIDVNVSFRRRQQVKIIVPNKIVGRIIGKGGSNFKLISENCGVNVKVSPKEYGGLIKEKCITITGHINGNNNACDMILDIIRKYPCHVNYNFKRYRRVLLPVLKILDDGHSD